MVPTSTCTDLVMVFAIDSLVVRESFLFVVLVSCTVLGDRRRSPNRFVVEFGFELVEWFSSKFEFGCIEGPAPRSFALARDQDRGPPHTNRAPYHTNQCRQCMYHC